MISKCEGLPAEARAQRERRWAHQDSNLERAGYEPAALTIELWARSRSYLPLVLKSITCSMARRQTGQNGTLLRVNMMQSIDGR